MEWYLSIPVGVVLAASFIWAVAKNFLTAKVKRLENVESLHVLVTGGSKGIGKALAKRAAIEGAHVTIVARNQTDLDSASAELKAIADGNAMERGQGQDVKAVSADCCDEKSVSEALCAADRARPVDVLVCNVGGSSQAPFEELPGAEFERMMRMNVYSAVHSIQALVAGMKERRKGRIVLLSSVAGQIGLFGYTAYSSAKFALRGLAEALQMELGPYDVRVTVAFPPNTDTEGFAKEMEEMPDETRLISGTVQTWHPDKVASVIWEDVMEGNHYSAIGFDGWLAARLTAGFSPETEPMRAVASAALAGPLRLVALGYSRYFDSLVQRCKDKRDKDAKKAPKEGQKDK